MVRLAEHYGRLSLFDQDLVETLICKGFHADTPLEEVTASPLFIEALKEVQLRHYVYPQRPSRPQRCAFCAEPSVGKFLVSDPGPKRVVVRVSNAAGSDEQLVELDATCKDVVLQVGCGCSAPGPGGLLLAALLALLARRARAGVAAFGALSASDSSALLEAHRPQLQGQMNGLYVEVVK